MSDSRVDNLVVNYFFNNTLDKINITWYNIII